MQVKFKAGEPIQYDSDAGALFDGNIEECRDHAGPFKWRSADLSRDGEFICGAAIVKGRHIVHLWQSRGCHIAAVLEGPQVGMVACAWHPDSSRSVLLCYSVLALGEQALPEELERPPGLQNNSDSARGLQANFAQHHRGWHGISVGIHSSTELGCVCPRLPNPLSQ